jgi:hypothetical protein
LHITDDSPDPKNKMLLIAMAQAWLKLAQQAEKNLTTDMVYEPRAAGHAPATAAANPAQDGIGRLSLHLIRTLPNGYEELPCGLGD